MLRFVVFCLAIVLVAASPKPEPKAKPDVLVVDEPTAYVETINHHGNLVYPSTYYPASYVASPYAYSHYVASPYAYSSQFYLR